jgi:Asp-tRNA(Asn)/Glu-tRNA(Gln) amidotransferase A subunit family amidase
LHLLNRSAVEIAAAIAHSEMTCEDVARAVLTRIEEREPVVHAWAFVDKELVLDQARRLDRAVERGPLHGVPVGIKDVIDTADMPTQMGSPIYAGYRPKSDAACVGLLRAAGALIVGKTVTAEFAGATAGPTTNPHDPERTPGGSSSGSGAAVADGMVPLALGTQTGGSIHRPASYCGVVGFKPTRALLNRAGVKPAAESLDTLGILARHVEDVAGAFAVLSNSPFAPLQPLAPHRIGLCRTPHWSRAQPETVRACEDAAAQLGRAGVLVVDVDLPGRCAALAEAREIVNAIQRAHAMADEWREHAAQLSEALQKTIRRGLATPSEHLVGALRTIEASRAEVEPLFADVDLLIAPCADGEAPRGLAWTGDHQFQSLWTMLDLPTVSLPTHAGPHGMPVSIQLVGAPYGDTRLLENAQSVWDLLSAAHVSGRRR